MKLGKFDFCKIKKITAIEISVLLIVLVALGIYFAPNFMYKKELKLVAKAKADNAIFTSKVVEEFSVNKNAKPSEIAKKVADELNQTVENSYNKETKAYTFEKGCKGCNYITYDDNIKTIIVETYDNKNTFLARTVIVPPSFVTYTKDVQKRKLF